jgi:tRNA (guanine-N7-)-methyltransferase
VRVIEEDVHLILRDSIPDQTLDAIHLLPDPWPKNGHHKRRIVQNEFLETIYPKIDLVDISISLQTGSHMPNGFNESWSQ